MNEVLSYLLQQAAVVVFMGLVIWTQQKEKNELKEDNRKLAKDNTDSMLLLANNNAQEVKELNSNAINLTTSSIEAITENSVAVNALHTIVKELKGDLK
jgi:hypothetical protein